MKTILSYFFQILMLPKVTFISNKNVFFFSVVGTYFSMNASFPLRKWIFWLVQTISFFPSSGNVFFNKSIIFAIAEGFSLYWKPSTLLKSSFLLAITDMSGNNFLKTDPLLPSGNSFSSYSKPFSFIASDIFQEVLYPS